MRRTLAAVAIGATAALAFAGTAQASTTCPTWTLHSITTGDWQDPAEGSTVEAAAVTLTKPKGGGTEFATKDAGITLDAAGTITVDYVLSDEADFAAGAVRLFYYDHAAESTLTEAPTGFAAADADSGTLTIDGVTKVGTLGLVYDASNPADGSVTFTGLKVGGEPVSFTDAACKPSPSPSMKPSPSKTAPAGGVPTTTAPTSGGHAATLPVTGSPVKTFVAVAAGGLLLGAVALLLSRRRRTRFTA